MTFRADIYNVIGVIIVFSLPCPLVVILILAKETLPLDVLAKLSHEKLDVYQKSIQFLTLSCDALNAMPRGYADLSDQLKRASLSVPLNIAEASGRTGSRDNAKHFAIARGSALECGAIFDACKAMQIIDDRVFSDGKQLLVAIVSMLSKLCIKR